MKKLSNQTILKIIAVIFIVITMVSCASMVYADDTTGTPLDPKSVVASYENPDTEVMNTVGKVMGAIRNAAVIISVIVLMVLGVKYVLGSVEEKADYKKAFPPLIIGIVLVVAATSIAAFIFNTIG